MQPVYGCSGDVSMNWEITLKCLFQLPWQEISYNIVKVSQTGY